MTDRPVERLAFSIPEAAESLGVSVTYFRLTILPELAAVRRGRRTLISKRELDRWLELNGAKLVDR